MGVEKSILNPEYRKLEYRGSFYSACCVKPGYESGNSCEDEDTSKHYIPNGVPYATSSVLENSQYQREDRESEIKNRMPVKKMENPMMGIEKRDHGACAVSSKLVIALKT